MSAPDELRQLADRLPLWHDGDDDTIAAMLEVSTPIDDNLAAAVALRHYANLTDSIGDPGWLEWWTGSLADIPETLKIRLARIADAVAAVSSGAATLTVCPTCGSDDRRKYNRCVVQIGPRAYTVDPWHNEAG